MDGRCWLYSSFFFAFRMHGKERKKKRGKSDRAERDALIGWRRVTSMMSAKWAAEVLRCTLSSPFLPFLSPPCCLHSVHMLSVKKGVSDTRPPICAYLRVYVYVYSVYV
mmetsp:Transcript_44385/g.115352  ORF Transcript_44385/g.115352 Transcript_44385/m.115352 type:complete len:109 (+) Transcript_44385:1731-2057(+)